MPPSGTVYGGFVFKHDEIIQWGKRLGAVIGEDMDEWTRKTPRQLRINSFLSAQATIVKQLKLHGSDLEPVALDTGDPVRGDWIVVTQKGKYSRTLYMRNPGAIPGFREGFREEKARLLLQEQGFSNEQLRFETRYT